MKFSQQQVGFENIRKFAHPFIDKEQKMNFPQLANQIVLAHGALQENAMRAVNQNITARNWLVGYWIVEFEQNGEDRANYGDRLLSSLSKAVKIKGLGTTVMSLCRKFYLTYPNLDQEIGKFLLEQKGNPIIQSVTEKLQLVDNNSISLIKSSQERQIQSATEKIPQVEAKELLTCLFPSICFNFHQKRRLLNS